MKTTTIRGRLLASTLFASAVALGAAAVVTVPTLAQAQDYTSGNLSGRVESDAGAPVAGATVTVRSGQGVTRTVTTDANGDFRVTALPIGGYTADVAANGYNGLSGQRVAVAPGGSSFTFTLSSGTVSEVVVTAATRANPDFTRTDTGLVVDVQEMARQVPVQRSIADVSLLTPGVSRPDATINAGVRRSQSTLIVSGTSAAESVYYINGMNVTDLRNLLGYSDLPFDAIASIDIKTGGYQAEFGRATGGVVNIVTRSGSNTWHGGATLTYTPEALRTHQRDAFSQGGSGVAGAATYNRFASLETLDSSVYLSGPIIKDRLFFFGLYNMRSTKEWLALGSNGFTGENLYTGVQTYSKSESPRWLAKFDLNITDRQRLEATLFSDANEADLSFATRDVRVGIVGQGLGYAEKSGGFNQIYKYTGAFTDWFTLSALYGDSVSDQQDEGPLVGTPRVRDRRNGTIYLTGATTAGSLQPQGEDERKTYRVDADFYVDLVGKHHFRLGYDKEELHSSDLHLYNGGYVLDINHGVVPGTTGAAQDYAQKIVLGSGGEYDAEQTAMYVQDSWDVFDGLTIQAGLRIDQYDYKNRAGQSYVTLDNQIAPRLGFTWDPIGANRDKIYGSFGRYYLPIATNTSIREVSGEDYHVEYRAVSVNADGSLVRDANGIPVLGARLRPDAVLALPIAPNPAEAAASNIEPMFEEEYILGYEHEFEGGVFDRWKAGVRYMHRNLASTIEDTDLGRGGVISRYCARTHDTHCVNNSATDNSNVYFTGAYILLNPGKDAQLMLDLENGPGGPNLRPVTLTAADFQLPEAKRTYDALEFTFERPFDGRWSLQGSYVLARSKGNYEGAVKSDVGQTDTSITQDFDAYFLARGAEGYLPNDHRHAFKLFGVYQVTDKLRAGANFFAQSGRPYGCIGFDPDDPSSAATPSSWMCLRNGQTVLTPRGSQGRTGWVTNTDLKLTYDLVPQRDGFGAVSADVDVFNVFNERHVTRVVEQGEATNLPGTPVPTYGLPRSYQLPRSVRFTLRYAF